MRHAMGGCLSQVGSQVIGWQVTSTTLLSDPSIKFPVRSVLRMAGPALFYLKFAERGYPARQVWLVSLRGGAADRRRQPESMPARQKCQETLPARIRILCKIRTCDGLNRAKLVVFTYLCAVFLLDSFMKRFILVPCRLSTYATRPGLSIVNDPPVNYQPHQAING